MNPSLARRWVAGSLTAVLGLTIAATVTVLVDGEWRHYVDSSIYILTAKSMAAGEGYTYLGEPFLLRPPGLSWLLGFLVRDAFDPSDVLTLNLLIQASAALTFLFVALVMRRLHGTVNGMLVTLLFAFNPLTVAGFNTVFAEFPHMALFFAGAWLLMPGRAPDGNGSTWTAAPLSWGRGLAGALCLGASLWFRTGGLLLIPALVLAALIRPRVSSPPAAAGSPAGIGDAADTTPAAGRWRQALRLAVLGAVALAAAIAPWLLHSGAARARVSRPVTQLIAFDLQTALLRTDARDPDSPLVPRETWAERPPANGADISRALAFATIGGEARWARMRSAEAVEQAPEGYFDTPVVALAVGLLFGACLVVTLVTRRSALDVYAVLYVLLLLLWFTFVQRLLLPVLPLLLSALVHTLALLGRWIERRLRSPGFEHVLVGAAAVLLLGAGLARLPGALAPDEWTTGMAEVERVTARWIRERTEPDDVILHERGPVMALLSGRTTYTWRHLPAPWPTDCPPVDWAFYGPLDKFPSVKAALRASANGISYVDIPLPDARITAYRLGER